MLIQYPPLCCPAPAFFNSQVPLLALCGFPFLFQYFRRSSETDGWIDFNPISQLPHTVHISHCIHEHIQATGCLVFCFLISSSPNQSFPIYVRCSIKSNSLAPLKYISQKWIFEAEESGVHVLFRNTLFPDAYFDDFEQILFAGMLGTV